MISQYLCINLYSVPTAEMRMMISTEWHIGRYIPTHMTTLDNYYTNVNEYR